MRLTSIWHSPRALFAATGLGALALVGGGLILARTMNLAACPLCILQRMLYLLLGLQGIVAVLLADHRMARRLSGIFMALTAITGASIATYQSWLQRFAKDISCTANQPWWERFVDWAGRQVPVLFEATGLCSEAGWKLLGLSIAEWSLLAFFAIAAVALAAAFAPLPGQDKASNLPK
jgi:disulfide bond formation protein DsbB